VSTPVRPGQPAAGTDLPMPELPAVDGGIGQAQREADEARRLADKCRPYYEQLAKYRIRA